MRIKLAAALLAAVSLSACAGITQTGTPGLTRAPLSADITSDLPRNARPLHYAIEVRPDATNLTFSGRESVTVEVYEPSDTLTLHANSLKVASARLFPVKGGGAGIDLGVSLDAEGQKVRFAAPSPIQPGTYRLDLDYTGTINTQANGLFALDYPDKRTGKQVRALFTQFEAPDARRFAPMFDEPSYKATFQLTAIVPETQLAVSNTPVIKEESAGGGLKKVTFGETPIMSSYLLFFASGDFERITKRTPSGVEAGIVAPAGSGEQARYALDSLAPLIGYYNDYFGVNFPLPKLDNVAAPGQSQFFGAMENWGAILTFEYILLEDPAISSPATRQNIFTTQAHETAHQWFGDLVTMAWWDDIWLNEGFASWLETKATDHFNPDWSALLGRVPGREQAMALDSFATTHPIVQTIRTVEDMNQAFDAITYQKGEAVIAMFEAYAGDEVWRAGLRKYMADHKYSNTVGNDLWSAIESAGAPGLTTIANDFTRQAGVPLVEAQATCANGQTTLTLKQSEYSRDRKAEVAAKPQRWRVPILASVGTGPAKRQILDGSGKMQLEGCGPVIVNNGQLGYYRTLYAPDMIAPLVSGLPGFAPIDQIGLVRDNISLWRGDYEPAKPALDLLAAVPQDANAFVADDAVDQWGVVYRVLEDEGDKAKLADLTRSLWSKRLDALGFEPRANEAVKDSNLRAELVSTLGEMGDPRVLAEARTRFRALANNPRALDGPLKTTWLYIAANNATAADWDLLKKLADQSTSTVEKAVYFERLGSAKDEALAKKALALALSNEVGPTTAPTIIAEVSGEHPELAYDFAMANRKRVQDLVDDSGQADYFADLAGTSTDPAMVAKLQQFRDASAADEKRPVERSLLALQDRLKAYPRMRQQIRAWLAQR
ncbi:MAG TPA: M1 family metallopeptidase [Croceibacterium sp.]|nr:M1 family metallopeptidase [Croceibacterium sp.]